MRKTFILAALGAVVGAAAIGGPLIAHDRGEGRTMRGGAAMFDKLDLDGDGTVTRSEVEGAPAARFAATDLDGDGQVTAAEIRARIVAEREARLDRMAEKMLESLDGDDDGFVSETEMLESDVVVRRMDRADWMFDWLDGNDDDAITAVEVEEAMSERRGRHGRHGRHRF